MKNSANQPNNAFHTSLGVLRSVVGQSVTSVYYKCSNDAPMDLGWNEGAMIHEVDQAVVISTASQTIVLEWRIIDGHEFLDIVGVPNEAATAGIADAHDVASLPPWQFLMTSEIAGFGIAMQPSGDGVESLWALRIDFVGQASVVVALGELRGGVPDYQPDNLLVIFDPDTASFYQVLDASESSWGRDLHL
ncbi:hypothetical protein [Kribbella sp. NPDC023855]|uniref:hypothetical protein n=1 Tax=Kribbella sp. NPDC023855 TaxID=3154698 RepID=UPI0033CC44CA